MDNFNDAKMARFCSFIIALAEGGVGGGWELSFHFILSKIVVSMHNEKWLHSLLADFALCMRDIIWCYDNWT